MEFDKTINEMDWMKTFSDVHDFVVNTAAVAGVLFALVMIAGIGKQAGEEFFAWARRKFNMKNVEAVVDKLSEREKRYAERIAETNDPDFRAIIGAIKMDPNENNFNRLLQYLYIKKHSGWKPRVRFKEG
jgi:hypothetical protein